MKPLSRMHIEERHALLNATVVAGHPLLRRDETVAHHRRTP